MKVLWDAKKLYVLARVQDGNVSTSGKEPYEQDSLEIYIDEDNAGNVVYGKDDKRYRINAENAVTCLGAKASEKNVESAVVKTEEGYLVEASFAWTDISPKVHNLVGFDLRVNDANAAGTRTGTLSWCDATGEAGTNASLFGTIKLAAAGEALEETENPDIAISGMRAFSENGGQDDGKSDEDGAQQAAGGELSGEKEVPDNPKAKRKWPIYAAVGVIGGGIGGVIGYRSHKKRKKDKK